MVGERDGNVTALDWIRRGEGIRDGGKGNGVANGVDGERASVERESAGVRVREGDEGRAMDGGGREVYVEGERDVGC